MDLLQKFSSFLNIFKTLKVKIYMAKVTFMFYQPNLSLIQCKKVKKK